MTGTTNDGAGRTPRVRRPVSRPSPPTVPSQRASRGPGGLVEVSVCLDASDESLDRVVAAAREAQAAGAVLHLLAAPEAESSGGAPVARERLARRLDMAAEVARALCPGLQVRITGPG